jgi:uncharacterized protein
MPQFIHMPLTGLTLLAAAAALGAPIAVANAQPYLPLPMTGPAPSVTTIGEASVDVVPNIAIISLGVETERPSAADAASENAKAAQAMVNDVKAQGIDARDVRTLGVTLVPVYDVTTDPSGRVTKRTLRGYRARNDLSVKIRQIDKASALARQWIEKGANSFGGVEFDYEPKEAKYDALRVDAVRDALRKATSYTTGLGVRLGHVIHIASPGPYPRPAAAAPMAARAAATEAAAIPIEAGIQTLRVEVEVSWELAQ